MDFGIWTAWAKALPNFPEHRIIRVNVNHRPAHSLQRHTRQRKQDLGRQPGVLELPSCRTFDEVLEGLIAIATPKVRRQDHDCGREPTA